MSCFAVKSASVRYNGHDALARADLVIQPGEAVGIVGPSGAGKTTLLRLLNAALRPASGAVEVDGVCLASLSNRELRAVRARIGFVHQDLSLVPNLRVVQNVVAGRIGRIGFLRSARSMIFPNKAEVSRVHRILERVGIPEKLFERTDSLSGGQRQRVAVARALPGAAGAAGGRARLERRSGARPGHHRPVVRDQPRKGSDALRQPSQPRAGA